MATLFRIYGLPTQNIYDASMWLELQEDNDGYSYKLSLSNLSPSWHEHSSLYSSITHSHISASITDATDAANANMIVKRSANAGASFSWIDSSTTITSSYILATRASLTSMLCTNGTINSLIATTISVSNTLSSNNFTANTGTIGRISTTTINATTISTTNITSATGTITRISTTTIGATTISTTDFTSVTGTINRISSTTISATTISTTNLTANTGTIDRISTTTINATTISTGTLTATYITVSTISVGSDKVVLMATMSNYVNLNVANKYTKTQSFSLATLALTSGSISWNTEIAQVALVTMSAAATLNNPTNTAQGATYILTVKQGASTAYDLKFGTAYAWPNGVVPSISNTLNSMNVFTFLCVGASLYGSMTPNYF